MTRLEHLPLDLLQTFALIVELGGNAAAAAERLGITQPSISKRLTALRRVTTGPNRQPWVMLRGRRWELTTEGQRVRGTVADLVRRYEQLAQFVASGREGRPAVAIACGQSASVGFVQVAVQRFLKQQPDCAVRIATPRVKGRIEGVAGGQFDLAVVTDSRATIARLARRELFVEELFEDRLQLAGNPPAQASWAAAWHGLPADRPVAAAQVVGFPFIVPEVDASRRKQFDEWCFQSTGRTVDVVIETGGWHSILDFAAAGCGVGLVTASAVETYRSHRPKSRLVVRPLDERTFPCDAVRLIARKAHGKEQPELTEQSLLLRQFLGEKSTPT